MVHHRSGARDFADAPLHGRDVRRARPMTLVQSAPETEPAVDATAQPSRRFLHIVAVVALGGVGVFAGPDLLRKFHPWNSDTPAGVTDSGAVIHDTVDAFLPRIHEY